MGGALCHGIGGVWVVVTSLINLGYTVNAAIYAKHTVDYPPRDTARIQIGIMAPQIAISSVFLGLGLAGVCPNKWLPIVYYAIPLAWSVGLLAHGAWALHSIGNEPQNTAMPLSGPSGIVPEARLSVGPAWFGAGAFGIRAVGRYD